MKYVGENALKKWTSLVKSDIKKKLDKNQGTDNARKALVVGADGNLVPEVVKDGFCITFNSGADTIVADKTLAEIQQAYNEGKTIYGILKQNNIKIYFNLYSATDTSFVFQNVTTVKINGEIANTNLLRIGGIISDNDIQWQEIDIHVPAFTDSDKEKLDSAQPLITATGLLEGDGAGNITAADTETATLVDVPNGLVKGDGTTLSAAVAGTDYMVPPTGGTTGQVLTKTADSQQWADAPKSLPDGGTTGDALVKSTDGGSWETPVEASLVEIMTKSEVESAIQSAIQNTWEASY